MARDLYTSDPHWFHDNIIKYCDRPTTPEEHTEWLIDLYNSQINPEDTVWCCGDLVGFHKKGQFNKLKEIYERLNGTWMHIRGNHDNHSTMQNLFQGTRHEYLGNYHEETIDDKLVVMFHYPIENWNKRGSRYIESFHIHGHVHNNPTNHIAKRTNVCLDNGHRVFTNEDIFKDSKSLL